MDRAIFGQRLNGLKRRAGDGQVFLDLGRFIDGRLGGVVERRPGHVQLVLELYGFGFRALGALL